MKVLFQTLPALGIWWGVRKKPKMLSASVLVSRQPDAGDRKDRGCLRCQTVLIDSGLTYRAKEMGEGAEEA